MSYILDQMSYILYQISYIPYHMHAYPLPRQRVCMCVCMHVSMYEGHKGGAPEEAGAEGGGVEGGEAERRKEKGQRGKWRQGPGSNRPSPTPCTCPRAGRASPPPAPRRYVI